MSQHKKAAVTDLDSALDGLDLASQTETLTDLIDRIQRDAFTRSRPRRAAGDEPEALAGGRAEAARAS